MKEITTMPVRVQNGNKEIEVYEYEGGFAMTTEFLGQCLGYAHPRMGIAKLFRNHKEALEPHRFVSTAETNPLGGRPTTFYDKRGILKAAAFANTPQAKEFVSRFVDYIEYLEAKRIERMEKYWFAEKRRPWWREVRDRVMCGENFQQIADAMKRNDASIRNAISRMIEIGILQALQAAQALTGTAKKTVLRYYRKFVKDDRQQALPFDETQTA